MEQKGQILDIPGDDPSYILKLAATKGGVIVSNDNFKRFLNHSDDFRLVIEERVLMYSFIGGTFTPAEDPLKTSLADFLRFKPLTNQQYNKRCPYRKKCTFGPKCKFWHPERLANPAGLSTDFQFSGDVQKEKTELEMLMNEIRMFGDRGHEQEGLGYGYSFPGMAMKQSAFFVLFVIFCCRN